MKIKTKIEMANLIEKIKEKLKILKKSQNARMIRLFVFVFLINFLIINWNDVSWLFNYKLLSRALQSFFSQNRIISAYNQERAEVKKMLDEMSGKMETGSGQNIAVGKEYKILIPRINIEAPIVFPTGDSEQDFQEALKKGVLYYPKSVLPGEEGRTFILGHSASLNWPEINYDRIFSNINELESGDLIYIISNNNEKHSYQVNGKIFLEKGEKIPKNYSSSKSLLYLISCWPPGKNEERIVVEARLLN